MKVSDGLGYQNREGFEKNQVMHTFRKMGNNGTEHVITIIYD